MKNSFRLLFACLGLLLLVGCVAPIQTPATTTTETASTTAETRVVTDKYGNKVEIPVNPQRIVALDYNTVEELLALGIMPVGILYGNNQYIADRVADVPVVGVEGVPNLEMVLQLKPDLIIAVDWWVDELTYAQLGEIAPTVMMPRENFRDWKQYLRNMGELLGRSEKAEELLAEYDAHVAQVREAIGEAWLAENEVTVFMGYNGFMRIWVDSFVNTVLNDVGVQIPQIQRDNLPEGDERINDLSLEQMPMLDADVLFYLADSEWTAEFNEILVENALWQQLPAVQAGKAYGLNVPFNEGSVLAAHMLLDTLAEHLAP